MTRDRRVEDSRFSAARSSWAAEKPRWQRIFARAWPKPPDLPPAIREGRRP